MRVLVIGSGGREHALAWRLHEDGADVIVAPGNEGMADVARTVSIDPRDQDAMIELARRERVELAIVGPEQPLVDGLADRLRDAGIATFGPSRAAARLEGSKTDAKQFMLAHAIPTAAAVMVRDPAGIAAALGRFAAPPVVKADGLAAGKGVTVAETFDEAEQAARACLERGVFGPAGAQIVLEERLVGEETSLFVLTDGTHACTLLPAQDHKRIGEGDTGPNTGGMGAYAPAPVYTERVHATVMSSIVMPTLAGLRDEGRPFVGALFVGLMIDPSGAPFVVEYNCRFGDPEVQPLVFGASAPLLPILHGAAVGTLVDAALPGRPAATVVLAAAGYPGTPRAGDRIHGLERLAGDPDVLVCHAGTRREGAHFVSAGGRVLGISARADALSEAIARAHAAADCIEFAGMQRRRDIGARALARGC
jgi:phosphoribosylamine--glycine ligase